MKIHAVIMLALSLMIGAFFLNSCYSGKEKLPDEKINGQWHTVTKKSPTPIGKLLGLSPKVDKVAQKTAWKKMMEWFGEWGMWLTTGSVLISIVSFLGHIFTKHDPKAKALTRILATVAGGGIIGAVVGITMMGLSSLYGWLAFIALIAGIGWYMMHKYKHKGFGDHIHKYFNKPDIDK